MDTLKITNKTRNPFTVPLAKGEIKTERHTIQRGGTGVVSIEAHQSAMKYNKAYRALIDQRKLIVTSEYEKQEEFHSEELETTAAPKKPADLDESPTVEGAEGIKEPIVESKSIEFVDAPAPEAPPKKAKKKK